MKKVIIGLAFLYLLGYALIRTTNAEVWDKDGETYVIFPESPRIIYYLYRPLSYADAAITGIRSHIGPHQ